MVVRGARITSTLIVVIRPLYFLLRGQIQGDALATFPRVLFSLALMQEDGIIIELLPGSPLKGSY